MDIQKTINVINEIRLLRDSAVEEDNYETAMKLNSACRIVTRICFTVLERISYEIAAINDDLQESADGLKLLVDKQ